MSRLKGNVSRCYQYCEISPCAWYVQPSSCAADSAERSNLFVTSAPCVCGHAWLCVWQFENWRLLLSWFGPLGLTLLPSPHTPTSSTPPPLTRLSHPALRPPHSTLLLPRYRYISPNRSSKTKLSTSRINRAIKLSGESGSLSQPCAI